MSTAAPGFLDRTGWGEATRAALAGDASTRRYERLTREGHSAILMCAPPQDRASFDAFIAVATRLHALGLSAPQIMAAAPDDGLMLLEDLGQRDFTALGGDGPEAVAALGDVLIHLARNPRGWDLQMLTPQRLAEMTQIALPEGSAPVLAGMAAVFEALPSRVRIWTASET